MTDEEKAKEITMKHFEINEFMFQYLLSQLDTVYNFYNGVLKGLAEGRKEIFPSFLKKKEMLETSVSILEEENAEVKELLKTFLLIADNKVSQMEFQLCVADAKQFLSSAMENRD